MYGQLRRAYRPALVLRRYPVRPELREVKTIYDE